MTTWLVHPRSRLCTPHPPDPSDYFSKIQGSGTHTHIYIYISEINPITGLLLDYFRYINPHSLSHTHLVSCLHNSAQSKLFHAAAKTTQWSFGYVGNLLYKLIMCLYLCILLHFFRPRYHYFLLMYHHLSTIIYHNLSISISLSIFLTTYHYLPFYILICLWKFVPGSPPAPSACNLHQFQ
jgi:hypothetical protein